MLLNLGRILLEYCKIETTILKKSVICLYKYRCSITTMDSTNIGFYKSNEKTEIMGIQQYFVRVAYAFINLEGIFAKMVKLAKQYWGNVATIFNVIWVIWLALLCQVQGKEGGSKLLCNKFTDLSHLIEYLIWRVHRRSRITIGFYLWHWRLI